MNRDESIDVLEALMRSFPQMQKYDDPMLDDWSRDLMALEVKWALDAVRACRDQHTFAPSWAQFREAYRLAAAADRDPSRRPYRPALTAGPVLSRGEHATRVAEVRRILNGPDMNGHDHRKGAERCPVCGPHTRTDGVHRPDHCPHCKTLAARIHAALTKENP
jgi:hypothetical protein